MEGWSRSYMSGPFGRLISFFCEGPFSRIISGPSEYVQVQPSFSLKFFTGLGCRVYGFSSGNSP